MGRLAARVELRGSVGRPLRVLIEPPVEVANFPVGGKPVLSIATLAARPVMPLRPVAPVAAIPELPATVVRPAR